MHNMIVEARKDGCSSCLFEEALSAVNNGNVVNNSGNYSTFTWSLCSPVVRKTNTVADLEWPKHLAARYSEMIDELDHYQQENNLVHHIRNRHLVRRTKGLSPLQNAYRRR